MESSKQQILQALLLVYQNYFLNHKEIVRVALCSKQLLQNIYIESIPILHVPSVTFPSFLLPKATPTHHLISDRSEYQSSLLMRDFTNPEFTEQFTFYSHLKQLALQLGPGLESVTKWKPLLQELVEQKRLVPCSKPCHVIMLGESKASTASKTLNDLCQMVNFVTANQVYKLTLCWVEDVAFGIIPMQIFSNFTELVLYDKSDKIAQWVFHLTNSNVANRLTKLVISMRDIPNADENMFYDLLCQCKNVEILLFQNCLFSYPNKIFEALETNNCIHTLGISNCSEEITIVNNNLKKFRLPNLRRVFCRNSERMVMEYLQIDNDVERVSFDDYVMRPTEFPLPKNSIQIIY